MAFWNILTHLQLLPSYENDFRTQFGTKISSSKLYTHEENQICTVNQVCNNNKATDKGSTGTNCFPERFRAKLACAGHVYHKFERKNAKS